MDGASMPDEPEQRLEGGNLTPVVRSGGHVLRGAGEWTASVHALLRHVRARGIDWVPEPFGLDESGRERLSYLEGDVYPDELPGWLWGDAVLVDAAAKLRAFHDATLDFHRAGGVWRLPAHEPDEVICHNDFAPYNFVFRGGRLAGVIDWDTASPGPRVWDLAYLAYRLVPLVAASNTEAPGTADSERARRLDVLFEAYGRDALAATSRPEFLDLAARRLDELAAFTAVRAQEIGPGSELWRHVELYRADAVYVRDCAHRGALGG